MIRAVTKIQNTVNITKETVGQNRPQTASYTQTDSFIKTEEDELNNFYGKMSPLQIKEQIFRDFAQSGADFDAFYNMIDKLLELGIISERLHDALGDNASALLKEKGVSDLFYEDYSAVLMGYYETVNADIKDRMYDGLTDAQPDKQEDRKDKGYDLDYRKEVREFMTELRTFMKENGFSFWSA